MNDDTISRQTAIDALIELSVQRDAWDSQEGFAQKRGINASICAIEDLPSAERHGHWCRYIDADELWNRLISVSENDWVGFVTIDEVLSEMLVEQRWIPVTERLPEDEGLYLVTCFNERPRLEVAWFYIDEEGFGYFSCDWSDFDSVTAWMPVPEPYKGGEEDKDNDEE